MADHDEYEGETGGQGYGSDLPPGDWSKYKFPPEFVGLDDFEITTPGGAVVNPHKGEGFWALPYVQERQLSEAGLDYFRALESGEDDQRDETFQLIRESLARIVVAWTITDNERKRYPDPKTPASWDEVPPKLFWHIWRAVQGAETEGKDKTDSGGSRRGSSTKRRS